MTVDRPSIGWLIFFTSFCFFMTLAMERVDDFVRFCAFDELNRKKREDVKK